MTVIQSPLLRIEEFNRVMLDLAPEPKAIASAKLFFQELLNYSNDPSCQKALNTAKILIDLKEEQVELALKVQSIFGDWKELEASISKASGETFSNFKGKIQKLQAAIAELRADAFPTETPKQKLLSALEHYDQFIETKNPSAWKTQAKINASIAIGIGAFFTYAPRILESAFTNFDQIVRDQFDSYICIQEGFCADSVSFPTKLSVGLLTSASLVLAAAAFNKTLAMAVPLLGKIYAWPSSGSAVKNDSVSSIPRNYPKTAEGGLPPISLNALPLPALHPSKRYAYDKLTQGCAPTDPLYFSIHHLADAAEALNFKVFQQPAKPLIEKSGVFAFPPSSEQVQHWTADFADPNLFGYVEGPLLAQEELLAVEHPVLYHFKSLLDQTPSFEPLADNHVVLLSNIGRYGSLDGLYGNEFALASKEIIDEKLKRFETPIFSNLFAMAALNNLGKAGEPYRKLHIKELFLKACTAFSAIAARSEKTKIPAVIHTGNWGAGAFGGSPLAAALCQILAARAAGLELHYYPLNETASFAKAQKILAAIEKQRPNAGAGEILLHLANNAQRYGIVYGQSNGT